MTKLYKLIINIYYMETLKLENVDDFYGHILARTKLIQKQKFERNKQQLIKETSMLPKNFQHRIAFMRRYIDDFDIRFWAQILNCCKAAVKICKAYPKGNFNAITHNTLEKLLDGFRLNQEEKAFAFSLAIANFYDQLRKTDFDSSLMMNVPDPLPVNPLGSQLYAEEIVIYRNSEEYAQIERLNNV